MHLLQVVLACTVALSSLYLATATTVIEVSKNCGHDGMAFPVRAASILEQIDPWLQIGRINVRCGDDSTANLEQDGFEANVASLHFGASTGFGLSVQVQVASIRNLQAGLGLLKRVLSIAATQDRSMDEAGYSVLARLARYNSSIRLHETFDQRGFFPWHDFSTGPDYWSEEGYTRFLQQSASGGSNVFYLHNYNSDDHRHYTAQMITWFGPPGLLMPNGSLVSPYAAYPTWFWSTLNGADSPAGRGSSTPTNTSDFFCGLAASFRHECGRLGAETIVADDACPEPAANSDAAYQTHEQGGRFFAGVSEVCKSVGIGMSLAVGTPLSVNFPANATDPGRVVISGPAQYNVYKDNYCTGNAHSSIHVGNESLQECMDLCDRMNCACFDHGVPPQVMLAAADAHGDRTGPVADHDFACRLTNVSAQVQQSAWHYTAYVNKDHPQPPPRTRPNVLASYRGMLRRARLLYGEDVVKYLTLWAYIQNTLPDWEAVAYELEIAQQAASLEGWDTLRLASGGWALGPIGNSTYIDSVAAKNVTITSLLPNEGGGDEDPAYSAIHGRGKWAIPWLEGDRGLLGPQLWLSRMVRHVYQAVDAGVTGMLSIHWRTQQVGPQLMAFERLTAPASCSSGPASSSQLSAPVKLSGNPCDVLQAAGISTVESAPASRSDIHALVQNATAPGMWRAFAASSFAASGSVLDEIVEAFLRIDGNDTWTDSPIPYVTFDVGTNVPESDAALDATYAFIERDFAPLVGRLPDAYYNAKFEYWPDSFRLGEAAQRLKLRVKDFEGAWQRIYAAPEGERFGLAHKIGLPAIDACSRAYENVTRFVYKTLASMGDLGVISDLQTNMAQGGVLHPKSLLTEYIDVPAGNLPSMDYVGEAPVLSVPEPVESTKVSLPGRWGRPILQALVLGKSADLGSARVSLCWRAAAATELLAVGGFTKLAAGGGGGQFQCAGMDRAAEGRGWFRSDLVSSTGARAGDVVQYYVSANVGGHDLLFPKGVDVSSGKHAITWDITA